MAEAKKARTFQLRMDTCRRIDEQSRLYELYGSELVDLILRRGLEAMENGTWILKRKPIKYKGEWG